MLLKRSDHSANTLGDQIIIVGGCIVDQLCLPNSQFCFCPLITSEVEAYNPVKDEWAALPPLPEARFRHAATLVNQKLYIIGGRDVNDNIITAVDVYDSVQMTWKTLNNSWINATSDLVAAAIGTNIFAIGGYSQGYDVEKTVWIFDTVNLSWSLHQAS